MKSPFNIIITGETIKNKATSYEVVELLKIVNEYLPRIRLEYDRVKEEMNSTKAELRSWQVAISNEVRVYQDFCNRNLALRNREDGLKKTLDELEAKEERLRKTITELQQHVSKLHENISENTSPSPPPILVGSPFGFTEEG